MLLSHVLSDCAQADRVDDTMQSMQSIAVGDVVFILEDLTISKARPQPTRACVCGVVVDADQPWAHVGRPCDGDVATGAFRPVCVKGQVQAPLVSVIVSE